MADGGWRMEDGGWRMADGGWRMEDGGWRGLGVPMAVRAIRCSLPVSPTPTLPHSATPAPEVRGRLRVLGEVPSNLVPHQDGLE